MSLLNNYLVIYLTYFIGLVCAILPLPTMLNAFRPDWMILIIFYWVLALPHRVSIGHAFILGIVFDLLLGSTLGMHPLIFSVLAYIVLTNYQLFRYFTIVQTTLIVGLFSFFSKLTLYLMASSLQDIILHEYYFWPVASSMVIWPWFFLLLRFIRLRFKVV